MPMPISEESKPWHSCNTHTPHHLHLLGVHVSLYLSHCCLHSPSCFPTYLSSALVKVTLCMGFFAFREHTGRSSGYMKTLLVARIQATCLGKQGNSEAVRRSICHKQQSRTSRASQHTYTCTCKCRCLLPA